MLNPLPVAVLVHPTPSKPTLEFLCPGCANIHKLPIGAGQWRWNGSTISPTLYPSVLYREFRGDHAHTICHLWLTDGKARFLSDSTHEARGLELPLMPVNFGPTASVNFGDGEA